MQQKPKITFTPAFFICWGALVLLEPGGWIVGVGCAMALHEAGHLIALYATGGGMCGVRFRLAGMEILRAPGLRSYLSDAAVSLCGPACSLVGSLGLLCPTPRMQTFAAASLLLGLLNILPIRTLDGGEALYALLCRRTGPERAARTARTVSFLFVIPLWMLAVWIMLMTGGNFSLFVLTVCLFCSTAFGA